MVWKDDGPEAKLYEEIESAIAASLHRDLSSGLELLDVLSWTVSKAIASVVFSHREALDANFYVDDFSTKIRGQVPLWLEELKAN